MPPASTASRRLVLVRRDNVEHLLLIGGPTDVVVEPNIDRPRPQRRPPHRRGTPRRARRWNRCRARPCPWRGRAGRPASRSMSSRRPAAASGPRGNVPRSVREARVPREPMLREQMSREARPAVASAGAGAGRTPAAGKPHRGRRRSAPAADPASRARTDVLPSAGTAFLRTGGLCPAGAAALRAGVPNSSGAGTETHAAAPPLPTRAPQSEKSNLAEMAQRLRSRAAASDQTGRAGAVAAAPGAPLHLRAGPATDTSRPGRCARGRPAPPATAREPAAPAFPKEPVPEPEGGSGRHRARGRPQHSPASRRRWRACSAVRQESRDPAADRQPRRRGAGRHRT